MLTPGLSIWGDYSESATKSYTAIEAAAVAAARRNDAMLFYVQDSRANVLSNSDAAYAIPTVGQAVGKWLDSQYGVASLGPELVSNGTFDTGIDWWTQTQGAISWNSGVLRTSNVAGVSGRAIAPIACEVGATYRIMVDRSTAGGLSTATVYVAISPITAFGNILVDSGSASTWSTMDRTFIATQTTHWIYLSGGTGTDGQYAEYDNVSVKKISEASATRGPELLANFDFSSWTGDDPTGWGLSPSVETPNIYVTNANPGARIVSTDGTFFQIFQNVAPTGKTFEVTIKVTAITGTLSVLNGPSTIIPLNITAPGIYRTIFTSTGLSVGVKRATAGVACDATIAWMSCKEVLGYHGSQPTVANKPTLARVPRKKQADIVINGGFDSSDNWSTVSTTISGGVLPLNTQFAYAQQDIAGLEVGASYEVSYDVISASGTSPLALSGTGFSGATQVLPSVAGVRNYFITTCTNASAPLKVIAPNASTAITIDNISLRKVTEWSFAVSIDGIDDWMDLTFRDHFSSGAYTFIASWWGPVTGNSSFGVAQSNSASTAPLVSPLFIPISSTNASIFERSDALAVGLSGTTYAAGALGRTSTVELAQIATPVGNFKGWLSGILDRNTNYTRVVDAVTTNRMTFGAAQRTSVSGYAKGTFALLCLAPVTMPEADRRTIARFAAFMNGTLYA